MNSLVWFTFVGVFAVVAAITAVYALLLRRDARRLRRLEHAAPETPRAILQQAAARRAARALGLDRGELDQPRIRQLAQRYALFSLVLAACTLLPGVLAGWSYSQALWCRQVENRQELADRIAAARLSVIDRRDAGYILQLYASTLCAPLARAPSAESRKSSERLARLLATFEATYADPAGWSAQERQMRALALATLQQVAGQSAALPALLQTLPDNPDARQLRGEAWLADQQWQAALEELDTGGKPVAASPARQLGVAECRMRQYQLELAANAFQQVLEAPVQVPAQHAAFLTDAYEGLAVARFLLDNPDAAQADLNRAGEELKRWSATSATPDDRRIRSARILANRACVRAAQEQLPAALADLRQAQELLKDQPPDPYLARLRGMLQANRAVLLRLAGRSNEARTAADEAVTLWTESEPEPATAAELELAKCLALRGSLRAAQGQWDEALDDHDRSVALCEQAHQREPTSQHAVQLADVLVERGASLHAAQRSQAALRDYHRALELYPPPDQQAWQQLLPRRADVQIQRAEVLAGSGFSSQALQDYERVVAQLQARIDRQPGSSLAERLAAALDRRGELQRDAHLGNSLNDHDQSIAICRQRLTQSHSPRVHAQLAHGLNNRGVALAQMGRHREALDAYREASDLYQRLVETEDQTELQFDWSAVLHNRAATYRALAQLDLALRDCHQAIALREPLWRAGRPGAAAALAASCNNRALVWKAMDQLPRALADHDRAVELLEVLVEGQGQEQFASELATHLSNRGNSRFLAGQYAVGVQDLDRSVTICDRLVRQGQGDSLQLAMALNNLAWIYATCPDRSVRDAEQSRSHAERACQLTNWRDARLLATLATACAEQGELELAVRWQSQAVDVADEKTRSQYRQTLEELRRRLPDAP
ncbi:MAG: tetratricopeptide repeat protein [Pirellulaceae bacterium]|nr:tetratricopeptide repeat protein [Pirellulaceae bacterium]